MRTGSALLGNKFADDTFAEVSGSDAVVRSKTHHQLPKTRTRDSSVEIPHEKVFYWRKEALSRYQEPSVRRLHGSEDPTTMRERGRFSVFH